MAAIKLPNSEILAIDNSNKAYPFEAKGYGDAGHRHASQKRGAAKKSPVKKTIQKRGRGVSSPKKSKGNKKGKGDLGYTVDPFAENARVQQTIANWGGTPNPQYSNQNLAQQSLLPRAAYPSAAYPNGVTGQQQI